MYLRAHPKRKSLISGVTAAGKHSLKSRSLGLFYFTMSTKKQPIQIDFEWMPSRKRPKSGGIYRLWFGEKYYIGRSRTLKYRIKSHRSDINARLAGTYKDPLYDPNIDMYQHVIKHIKKLKGVTLFKAEVLIYCDTDDELVANEQKWFDKVKSDKNCLNYGFEAKPYKKPRPDNFVYRPLELRPAMVAKQQQKRIKIKEKKEQKRQKKSKPVYQFKTAAEKIAYLKSILDKIAV